MKEIMEHNDVIKILRAKAIRDEYVINNNRIDNKRVLDDYYLLLKT
jgi:hypothetical protein